jgi:hypothetical protein
MAHLTPQQQRVPEPAPLEPGAASQDGGGE